MTPIEILKQEPKPVQKLVRRAIIDGIRVTKDPEEILNQAKDILWCKLEDASYTTDIKYVKILVRSIDLLESYPNIASELVVYYVANHGNRNDRNGRY